MFVSEHYVAKAWPTHERQHAQARALVAKEEYILPARFDDTEVPGMTNAVAYVDLCGVAPGRRPNTIARRNSRRSYQAMATRMSKSCVLAAMVGTDSPGRGRLAQWNR